MSAIFGIMRFDGAMVAQRDLARMGEALRHRGPDGVRFESLGRTGIGHCLMRVNREDRFEAQPLFDDASGLALVADCRIDNRAELAATFAWDSGHAHIPDSNFILEACKRWGERAPEKLEGDFVFALWDDQKRRLLLARDPMGQRHVHFHVGPESFAFATDLAGLWPLPEVPQRICMNAIGRRLFGDAEGNAGKTFYQDIEALAGGTTLTIGADRALHRATYWTPRADPAHLSRSEEYYVETYRRLLGEAVGRRVERLLGPPALSLSGGIDSGAIAGIAGPVLAAHGMRLIGVTSVAQQPGSAKDARAAAESCAEWMPHLELHFYQRGNETAFDGLEEKFAQEGTPWLSNYVLRGIAREARAAGARLFMDGAGGDYTINFRGPLDWRPWLRRGQFSRAWRAANAVARSSGRWRLGALVGLALPRLLPVVLVDAWLAARRGFVPRWRARAIAPALAHALIRRGEADPRNVRGAWRPYGSGHDWMTHVLDRLRREASAAHAVALGFAGLELTRPFHDPAIVGFALAIPEELLFRGNRFRHLARQALAGLLPPEALEASRPNDAYEPDYAAMRRELIREARRDALRFAADTEFAAMVDFDRVQRLLRAAETAPNAQSEFSAPAIQAVAVLRFLDWSRRRNR